MRNQAKVRQSVNAIIFASIMAFRERSGTPHNRGSFAGSQPCSANNDTLFYGGLRSSDLGGLYPSCVICCAVSNSSCTRRNTCATCTARRQRSVSEWAEFNVQLDFRSLTHCHLPPGYKWRRCFVAFSCCRWRWNKSRTMDSRPKSEIRRPPQNSIYGKTRQNGGVVEFCTSCVASDNTL